MSAMISTYRTLTSEIELSSSHLDSSETLHHTESELENFYDGMYDSIDIIKLYKKQLQELKEQDGLFDDLYETVNKLHLTNVSVTMMIMI